MNTPYFHLTLPHLRAAVQLPEIPFSKGQPSLSELESLLRDIDRQRTQVPYAMPLNDSVPPRSLPPSHSASPVHGKSAFGGQDGRILPPPKVSPDIRPYYQPSDRPTPYNSAYSLHATPNPENPNALSASSSQTMLNLPYGRPHRGGASALVDQLRELDLPTDALSTFGRRSDVALQERTTDAAGLSRIVPPPLHHPGGFANTMAPPDRNIIPWNVPAGSTSSLSFRSNNSDTQLPAIPAYQRNHLPPHMATPTTLISGQQPVSPYDAASHYSSQHSFEAGSSPMLASLPEDVDMVDTSTSPARRPDPQAVAQASSHALPISSKKKKWGLSSVFGSSHDKQQPSIPSANIASISANSSLKRTQSGAKATDRFQSLPVLPPPQIDVGTITDPKKAKKEAERQAKELERARRDAMERAQKERARAVMQKRSQLEQQRKIAGSKTELEWSHVHGPTHEKRSEAAYSSKTSNTSGTSVPRINPDSPRPPSLYQQAGSFSSFSVHSGESSQRQKLSEHNLRQTQAIPEIVQDHDPYRAKARRRNDNDDHSTSNYSVPSLINASLLTVDSE